MRSFLLLSLFLLACASSEPALVPVLGAPEDLSPLTGEWTGTFENRATGRSGSITFHLTEDPTGAHGDVVLVPRTDVVVNQQHLEPHGGPMVLDIDFVRVAGGEINGRIAPYPDPDDMNATVETQFSGRVKGRVIEGTFVTYSTRGVGPQRGTWTVKRRL